MDHRVKPGGDEERDVSLRKLMTVEEKWLMHHVETDGDLYAQRIFAAEDLRRHRRRRSAHELSDHRRGSASAFADKRNDANRKPRGLGIELRLAPCVRHGGLPRLIEQRRGIGVQIFDVAD